MYGLRDQYLMNTIGAGVLEDVQQLYDMGRGSSEPPKNRSFLVV
jgi:hypothetical protein